MHWALINGSPRGKRGNTVVLLDHLARGLAETGHSTEVVHLALPRGQATAKEQFRRGERIVIAFPLYTDAMPGQVMELFEALEEFSGRADNPPIAFLVQSGFPAAGQCRAVEHWLELFAQRLGARHLGTIVKGGVEGIRAMPPWMTRRLFREIEGLGHSLGSTGGFDPKALRKLAGPDWTSRWRISLFRLGVRLGATPFWNRLLKGNGAFARRFDRPFESTVDSDAPATCSAKQPVGQRVV